MISGVPYWGDVNWAVIGTLFAGIGAFSSPFLLAWWNRKLAAPVTKAHEVETQLERIERQRNELYEQMEKRAKEAEAEITELARELDLSRAQARAMEEWAHWARHGWISCKSRFRAFRRIVARANQSPVGFTEIQRLLAITKPRKIPVIIPTLTQVLDKTPPEEPEEIDEDAADNFDDDGEE